MRDVVLKTPDLPEGKSSPRAARREELLRVAASVFAEKGFANATVREIAERAGMLSGSLYYHFESKDAMLEELLRSYLESVVGSYEEHAASSESAVTALENLIDQAYHFVVSRHDEVMILQDDYRYLYSSPQFTAVITLLDRITEIWAGIVEQGTKAGVFDASLDPKMTYRIVISAISTSVRWFDPAGAMSTAELAAHVKHICLYGLTVRSERGRPGLGRGRRP
jgi:AcrR family transcriptional regulator